MPGSRCATLPIGNDRTAKARKAKGGLCLAVFDGGVMLRESELDPESANGFGVLTMY